MDFEQARSFCDGQGLRLCTETEIKSGAGESTGCESDTKLQWTSSSCDVTGRNISNHRLQNLNLCRFKNSFGVTVSFFYLVDNSGYSLISRRTNCKPSTAWLGHMSILSCAIRCSNSYHYFVHATDGDNNCKCITTDDCTRTTDTGWGLALYKITMKGRERWQ